MGKLDRIAAGNIPKVFARLQAEGLCELVNIVRAIGGGDGYGNQTSAESIVNAAPIPAIREPETDGNPRALHGGEWTSDKFMMPSFWNGAAISIRETDKLRRLESGIAAPEKTFTVTEVRNYKTYYEVITTIDKNEN